MIKRFLVIGIILLFICMSINPSIAVDNVKKSSIPVSDYYILCIGRIDNLSINETTYKFDCINVRMIVRYYYNESPMYGYIHSKKNNVIGSMVYRKDWEFDFNHYYDRDFYRFTIEKLNFSGILKPTFIIGIFYLSINNTSSFYDNELIENNKIKYKDESIILQDSNFGIYFFIGTISDLYVDENNCIFFNTTNVFSISYTKLSNHVLIFRIQRIRSVSHSFGFGGLQFRGILTSSFICGFFYYYYKTPLENV